MHNRMNQRPQPELYFEAGQVKLRFKQPITKDMFPEEAQESAEAMTKASQKKLRDIFEPYLRMSRDAN